MPWVTLPWHIAITVERAFLGEHLPLDAPAARDRFRSCARLLMRGIEQLGLEADDLLGGRREDFDPDPATLREFGVLIREVKGELVRLRSDPAWGRDPGFRLGIAVQDTVRLLLVELAALSPEAAPGRAEFDAVSNRLREDLARASASEEMDPSLLALGALLSLGLDAHASEEARADGEVGAMGTEQPSSLETRWVAEDVLVRLESMATSSETEAAVEAAEAGALLHGGMGNPERAVVLARWALSTGRATAVSHSVLCGCLGVGKDHAALEEAAAAWVAEEDTAPARWVQARALAGLGRPAEALAAAERALSLAPESPTSHLLAAALELQVADDVASRERCRAHLALARKAMGPTPTDEDDLERYHQIRAALLALEGWVDEAQGWLRLLEPRVEDPSTTALLLECTVGLGGADVTPLARVGGQDVRYEHVLAVMGSQALTLAPETFQATFDQAFGDLVTRLAYAHLARQEGLAPPDDVVADRADEQIRALVLGETGGEGDGVGQVGAALSDEEVLAVTGFTRSTLQAWYADAMIGDLWVGWIVEGHPPHGAPPPDLATEEVATLEGARFVWEAFVRALGASDLVWPEEESVQLQQCVSEALEGMRASSPWLFASPSPTLPDLPLAVFASLDVALEEAGASQCPVVLHVVPAPPADPRTLDDETLERLAQHFIVVVLVGQADVRKRYGLSGEGPWTLALGPEGDVRVRDLPPDAEAIEDAIHHTTPGK